MPDSHGKSTNKIREHVPFAYIFFISFTYIYPLCLYIERYEHLANSIVMNQSNVVSSVKKRQVNIELLRIIAMILVLLTHTGYGKCDISLVHSDIWKAIGTYEVDSCIFVCVPCFVVISGYFGIRWKWKGLFNYLFQIGFWGGVWFTSSLGD